ncbi:MAG: OmpA family protein [Flavobacteriia bacterium]|nr:OmpA family protein [Flavobacteriia bacterium]
MKNSILLILCFFTAIGFGQVQKSKNELKGDKLYFVFAFHEAISKYEKTELKDTLTSEGIRKLADSYLKINEFVKSEAKYAELVKKPEATANDYYAYANVLKMNGKYTESEKWMKAYFDKAPTEIRSKINQLLLDKVEKLKVDKGYFNIKELPINTDGQEFAPFYYGEQLIYSANAIRHDGIIIKNYIWNNTAFLDLFIYDPLNTDSIVPKIEFKEKFNKKFHEGVVSFSADLKKMYFTANNYEKKALDGSYNLEIYWTEIKEDGEWGEPVPFEYNNPEYSVGHPYLTKDGKTLYFSSNMPGGVGGTDIYKCTWTKDGIWSQPVNLGQHINTEGDELFPFFHDEKQILFFSSNGQYGLGGLDIYATALKDGVFGKVNNFGAPLNSQYDDFGIVIDDKMSKGYFSSNRISGKGNDDIYGLEILKELKPEEFVLEKIINGVVKNIDGKPVPNAKVELFDEKGNLVKTVIAKTDGKFDFKALENHDYTLISSKDYYINDTSKISTVSEDLAVNTTITLEVKEEIVIVDNVAFIKVQTIYFDVNSSELREDTKDKLANVIKIMNENPSMSVELGSHTDCRGTEKYNMKLSQERALKSAEFIRQYISNPERIHGVGYGESQLVNNCPCEKKVLSTCSEEEHQANRRTEFKIINKTTMDITAPQETPILNEGN